LKSIPQLVNLWRLGHVTSNMGAILVVQHLVPSQLMQLYTIAVALLGATLSTGFGLARPYGGRRMLFRSLVRPRTFNEKIQRLKIFNRDPRLPQRENKILVKEFVKDRIGSEWVTPTLWHGEHLPPVEQRRWPIPFVIKANNGCGWNVFVRTEADLNWPHIEGLAAEWRHTPFGVDMGEWLYGEINPGLLVEPFLGDFSKLPVDYKFWTFGGRVQFVEVITDRENGLKATIFDTDWHRLPFTVGYPPDPRPIPKPVSLGRMIEAAEILAEDFSFVRIDFYEIDNHPKFGEMTFYPGSGHDAFNPPEWDAKVGELWR
jgi:TupA-like ATPgrasp